MFCRYVQQCYVMPEAGNSFQNTHTPVNQAPRCSVNGGVGLRGGGNNQKLGGKRMSEITMKQMLEAGLHFRAPD